MTYVVTENRLKCKYMDCVEVCPVDCFHAGENMLVINPDECIDCGVCVPECPADAIFADSDPEAAPKRLELNKLYARRRPKMTHKDWPPLDADAWDGVQGKAPDLSPEPHRQASEVSL